MPIFQLLFPVYEKWIGRNGLVSIWHLLHLSNSTLELENHLQLHLPRQHDQALMDVAIQLDMSPKALPQPTACRLYLLVLMLSNIVTANGKQILANI
jgi:hypothetical protein